LGARNYILVIFSKTSRPNGEYLQKEKEMHIDNRGRRVENYEGSQVSQNFLNYGSQTANK